MTLIVKPVLHAAMLQLRADADQALACLAALEAAYGPLDPVKLLPAPEMREKKSKKGKAAPASPSSGASAPPSPTLRAGEENPADDGQEMEFENGVKVKFAALPYGILEALTKAPGHLTSAQLAQTTGRPASAVKGAIPLLNGRLKLFKTGAVVTGCRNRGFVLEAA